MPNVLLISYHTYNSKRKAGFHWIANSLADLQSWSVSFVTAPISVVSKLYQDHRFDYINSNNFKKWETIGPDIQHYIHFTLFQPFTFKNKILDWMISPLNHFLTIVYGLMLPRSLMMALEKADLVIFESTSAISLFKIIKQINPHAKIVYRVSDDLKLIGVPKSVLSLEERIAPCFDLISVPSESLYNKFSHLQTTRLQRHGINKQIFDGIYEKPEHFNDFEKNLIYAGMGFFDHNFLSIAAKLFPSWGFHIIGPIEQKIIMPNIVYYGEVPFTETLPFLKHADVGLQILRSHISVESFSDSLKIIQYTYCGLPIVAPADLVSRRSHVFSYIFDDENSIRDALMESVDNDVEIDRSNILSWDELVEDMLSFLDLN